MKLSDGWWYICTVRPDRSILYDCDHKNSGLTYVFRLHHGVSLVESFMARAHF